MSYIYLFITINNSKKIVICLNYYNSLIEIKLKPFKKKYIQSAKREREREKYIANINKSRFSFI